MNFAFDVEIINDYYQIDIKQISNNAVHLFIDLTKGCIIHEHGIIKEIDLDKEYSISDIYNWLSSIEDWGYIPNCSQRYGSLYLWYNSISFFFRKKEDAMLFKLTFGGDYSKW